MQAIMPKLINHIMRSVFLTLAQNYNLASLQGKTCFDFRIANQNALKVSSMRLDPLLMLALLVFMRKLQVENKAYTKLS